MSLVLQAFEWLFVNMEYYLIVIACVNLAGLKTTYKLIGQSLKLLILKSFNKVIELVQTEVYRDYFESSKQYFFSKLGEVNPN